MSTQENLSATTRHAQFIKKFIFGKEQHPVYIMTLDPPKEFPWKIGASLDQLYRIMINIVEFHSIPDIITAVAD